MNVYFCGLGGVGIGPLAEIARDAGYHIAGSDLHESLVLEQLRDLGVRVYIGQDGTNIAAEHAANPIDWFVYTSAIDLGRPELEFAEAQGMRTSKRDEFLAEILRAKNLRLVAIAGTHGKTTTTGMMVWTMKQLGIPVSYSVGTTLSWGPSGAYDPTSQYFVYECDEFDRNFLHFEPYLSLITRVDYDHPDTYPTRQEYSDAFSQFIDASKQTIMWASDAQHINVPGSAWVLPDNEVIDIHLAGAHNRRNATLITKAMEYLSRTGDVNSFSSDSAFPAGARQDPNNQIAASGSDEKDVSGAGAKVIKALESFPGTDRRFEKLAENLYTDYGHHPAEIAATLQMARELSDHVVLVYQPHQNIRQHELRDQYTDCMQQASEIYWLPTYLSREDPELEVLIPEQLMANLANRDVAQSADMNDELWDNIQRQRNAGHLVLVMGAGTIDAWVRAQLPHNRDTPRLTL